MSEATVNSISQAISKLDDHINSVDYKSLSPAIATQFKNQLLGRDSAGKTVSVTTAYHALRHIKKFLKWLSGEQGFRSGRLSESADYLTLDNAKVREATAQKFVESPTLEYVVQLVDSIKGEDEISRRDRALIAFLLCSGMRDLAVATLPIGCFDRAQGIVSQEPSKGVRTKFSKTIYTKLLPFGSELLDAIFLWYDYLVDQRKFGPDSPLFPRTKSFDLESSGGPESFQVEPIFWKTASPIRQILKVRSEGAGTRYFKPHAFRQAQTRLIQRLRLTPEQMKAISQNLGHENIGTTLRNYGNLTTAEALEIVSTIDLTGKANNRTANLDLDALIEMLTQYRNGNPPNLGL